MQIDDVIRCPHYHKETLIVGFQDNECEDPVFDVCELCTKNGHTDYCLCDGDNSECEVFNEERED